MKKMSNWWGEYTEDLAKKGYVENGENQPYKFVREPNGKWEIIKFLIDSAIYSCCPNCGFIHATYKNAHLTYCEYDESQEYNYCPMCGDKMLEQENENERD